jgi:hypothetical protein
LDGGNNWVRLQRRKVGFKKEDEKTIWIDEAELTDDRVSPFRKGYLRIILGPTDEDITRIEDKLKALGVTMTDPRHLDAPAADGESIDVGCERADCITRYS